MSEITTLEMEKPTTQEKVILSIGAISLLTNNLNALNTEMRFVPSIDTVADQMQKDREEFHQSIADKLAVIAEELADFMNDIDAVDENTIAVLDPVFNVLNADGLDNSLTEEDLTNR